MISFSEGKEHTCRLDICPCSQVFRVEYDPDGVNVDKVEEVSLLPQMKWLTMLNIKNSGVIHFEIVVAIKQSMAAEI